MPKGRARRFAAKELDATGLGKQLHLGFRSSRQRFFPKAAAKRLTEASGLITIRLNMPNILSTEDSAERRSFPFRSYGYRPARSLIPTSLVIGLPLVAVCMYVAMSLVPIVRSFVAAKERQLEAQQQTMLALPEMQARIENLENRLKLLTTASIEARVSTIETALRVGNVSADQVASLEDLRKELEVLKSYMFSDPKGLVELKQMETDYRLLTQNENMMATKEELRNASAAATDRLYLTWAFLGIIFAIMLADRFIPRRQIIPTKPIPPAKSE
jgi:hypothetical protein